MKRFRSCSWMNVWWVMSNTQVSYCAFVGSSPWISR